MPSPGSSPVTVSGAWSAATGMPTCGPSRVAANDEPSAAVVDFVLAPEPESRHAPRVRLVAV